MSFDDFRKAWEPAEGHFGRSVRVRHAQRIVMIGSLERGVVGDAGPAAFRLGWILGQERFDYPPQFVGYEWF